MNDHELGRLLRDLPRPVARPGLTEDVLAALPGPGARRPRRRVHRRLAMVAAAALLVVVPLVGLRIGREIETRRARAELARLRSEQRQLAAALRAFESSTRPRGDEVIYLGGDDTVDIVFDVDRAARLLRTGQPAVVPAGLGTRQPAATPTPGGSR